MALFAAMQASVVAMGILLGATGAGTGVPEDATPGSWMRSGQRVVGVKREGEQQQQQQRAG
jgi:hypothetical protein